MKKMLLVCSLVVLFLGCSKGNSQSTISVVGLGTVSAKPDMLQITISLSQTAQTTRKAQEEVNIMVRQALEIIKQEGIGEKNISTSSLRFNQEYEYDGNERKLIGQKVEQTITFSVNDIQQDNEKASRLLDKLAEINNIALNQIDFSIKDNREYFIKSRELAYEKALEKAIQYAELSRLKIIKTISISELENPPNFPMNNRMYGNISGVAAKGISDAGATMLPTGEVEITTQIAVVFLLD